MNFLNPAVLFGLIAASIPIILHLLNLRKLKTVEFSSLMFLQELQKTKIRRLKLKQILLLILRTLIIVFAVLAFARPTVKSNLPLIGTYTKTSNIILIDNSFSMDISDESGNRFNQAKKSALTIINNMKDGDETAIIPMADFNISILESMSANKSELIERLNKLKISNSTVKLDKTLRYSQKLIQESINLNKSVYIISDVQPNVFISNITDSLKLFDNNTSLFVIPIGSSSNSEITNLSIDSIKVITGIFQQNKPVEVEALIRNNSRKPVNSVVLSMYFNNEKVAQRSFNINPGESSAITISAEPKSAGAYKARIEIEPDALDYDNTGYFAFIVPDKPDAALIGNNENISYIKFILDGYRDINKPANLDIFSPNQISQIDLNKYDVIIYSGGELKSKDFERINSFINSGISMMLFASEETDFQIFKRGIAGIGFGDINIQNSDQPFGFDFVDRFHPIFEGVFKGTTDSKKIIESPKIHKMYSVRGGYKIIGTQGNNFLSELKRKNSKVLFCGVESGTKWSNFPLTGLFPIFIYRIINYLASIENNSEIINAGDDYTFNIPPKYTFSDNFKITLPDGSEFFQQAIKLPTSSVLRINNLNDFGNYSISDNKNKTIGIISVNHDKTESSLNKISNADIITNLKIRTNNSEVEIINPNNIISGIQRARIGTELWQLFIVLALVLAITEMIISRTSKNDVQQ